MGLGLQVTIQEYLLLQGRKQHFLPDHHLKSPTRKWQEARYAIRPIIQLKQFAASFAGL